MADSGVTAPQLESSLGPLIGLLQGELRAAGIATPALHPATASAFSAWYLEVVPLLQAQVAAAEAQAPMTRTEVELMCRCALTAATLRQAIDLLQAFSAMLHPRAGCLALQQSEGRARFVHDSLRQQTTRMNSLVDITGLFAFKQLFQWLVGGTLPLRQVGIGPLSRDDVMPFLQLFGAPVLTGGDAFYLEYEALQLERSVVRQPGEFAAFFRLFPCAVFDTAAQGLVEQVSAIFAAALQQGMPLPGLRQVAQDLEMPESTFRRRLSQAGTNYRALRERSLRGSAEYLLQSSGLSIEDLARRLGFSDATAFRRAFRGWTGMSPSDWRATQGGAG